MSDKNPRSCNYKTVGIGLAVCVVIGVAVGVGVGLYEKNHNSNSGRSIPYVTPPVKAACPPSLKGSATQSAEFRSLALDPNEVVARFFNPSGGPTNLFDILSSVDQRVQGINDRMSQFSCMSNTATAYQLDATWTLTPTFYAQCSEVWQGGAAQGFDQWGQVGSTTYLYVRGGDGIAAAQLVGNGTFGNIETVTIWFSVGIVNRNGSHCVAMVYARPSQNIFEMSVAGNGIGFCGAQLKSDGSVLNVTGSIDMGTTCNAVDSSCTSAASITTPATCGASVDSFSLPAFGRKSYATFGASAYPGGSGNQVSLTVTGNDATFFGPSSPTV